MSESSDAPKRRGAITFDEAREIISEIARDGEGPDKFRALKMLMGLEGSGVGLPDPLTDNDALERLARLIRAVGPTGSQIAYRRAFPASKRSIDANAPKISEADMPPIDRTKLPKNLRELYRMFPEIKKPGIPPGFPLRAGLEAQKRWCNDAAVRILMDREQARVASGGAPANEAAVAEGPDGVQA